MVTGLEQRDYSQNQQLGEQLAKQAERLAHLIAERDELRDSGKIVPLWLAREIAAQQTDVLTLTSALGALPLHEVTSMSPDLEGRAIKSSLDPLEKDHLLHQLGIHQFKLRHLQAEVARTQIDQSTLISHEMDEISFLNRRLFEPVNPSQPVSFTNLNLNI